MNHRLLLTTFLLATTLFITMLPAQKKDVNYDEAKVPSYELPDPLVMNDGTRVTTKDQWSARRAEILAICRKEMYGQSPGPPAKIAFETVDDDDTALDGTAIRRQVVMHIGEPARQVNVAIYIPKSDKPVPVFVGVNFKGNHAISDDSKLIISPHFVAEQKEDKRDDTSLEATRGKASSRWPLKKIIDRGYAVATIYCADIDPDRFDDFKNGIHAQYPELQNGGDNFTTVGAWAWGLSRVVDYFESDPQIDAKRVAVVGHSRMGKTSMWAGATDERFALVISNDSGSGGAAISRRRFGERVDHLTARFPHWFCKNFSKYNNAENDLPLDQHFVFSLMAPRPVYVASAEDDKWADPKGEFLSLKATEPVYALFGKDGVPAKEWPAVNSPSVGTLGYHVRNGKHDINDYDWSQYLDFADKHLAEQPWGSLLSESLAGWTALPAGEWKMVDGVLHGTSPASEKRHGMLLSNARYGDFEAKVVYRSNKGNSGLYFRCDQVNSGVSVNGFQAEIDPTKDVGGLYETGGRGWVVQPKPEDVAKYFKPGDWNEMVVRAAGRNVTVHVNGTKTAELVNDKGRTEGHLGLQLHGGQDMDVEFKSVEIQPLP